MSTSENLFMLTRNISHRQRRQQQLSTVTELTITTNSIPNSKPSSSPLSTPAAIITTRPAPARFQKPFSNFIDIIVAFFTAFVLAWSMLVSNGEKARNKISIDLNCKDNSSSIDSSTGATTSTATTAMELSSTESLKTLLSTDSISDDRLTLIASGYQQNHSTESQLVPQCSIPQDTFLGYGSNTFITDRHLFAIPELEEENDELCGSQWNSSSPLCSPTAIPNIWFDSGTSIRPVSSNCARFISSHTDHVTDLTNYNLSNLFLINQNTDAKLFSSNWTISPKSSDATISSRRASEPVLTVPHSSVPPPSPPLSSVLPSLSTSSLLQLREIWSSNSPLPLPLPLTETEVAATITAGNLTFDIPDLPAIDSEDTDSSSRINPEILHSTPAHTAVIANYFNNTNQNCSVLNNSTNFIQQNKMKRVTDIVAPINNAQAFTVINHSDSWDQNEIVVSGLLDTISKEETCSLNSTSISVDHSRDSILDFSICSNPIDEAAIMEEQLAASGELNDDMSVVAHSTGTTLPFYIFKDTGHSLTNRTIFTTATAVASTTGSNCQPVSPSAAPFITACLPPLLFNTPPIASLEDLTNGEQNSDIITARSDFATSSATSFGCNRIRKGRGRTEQGVGNGKDADADVDDDDDDDDDDNGDDNSDISGRSDCYRQTSASTIKRYIIRSGWFFRPYQHARPLN